MDRPTYMVDAMRDYFASTVPTIHGYIEEYGRESVQISIWLVGLATALLGFFGTMPRAFAPLSRWHPILLIGCLALTVLLGLLQRVLYQITENRMRQHLLGLRGHLDAAALAPHVVIPDELQDSWTIDDIVGRLSHHFSIDYDFLAEPRTPLEFARNCYRGAYGLWQNHDMTIRAELGKTVSAYTETSREPKQLEALFISPTSVGLEDIQRETDCIDARQAAVRWIAFACYGSFAASIVALALALAISITASAK